MDCYVGVPTAWLTLQPDRKLRGTWCVAVSVLGTGMLSQAVDPSRGVVRIVNPLPNKVFARLVRATRNVVRVGAPRGYEAIGSNRARRHG